jgi:hypothetical protein
MIIINKTECKSRSQLGGGSLLYFNDPRKRSEMDYFSGVIKSFSTYGSFLDLKKSGKNMMTKCRRCFYTGFGRHDKYYFEFSYHVQEKND